MVGKLRVFVLPWHGHGVDSFSLSTSGCCDDSDEEEDVRSKRAQHG